MARYRNILVEPATTDLPRRYINIKYPEILRDYTDIYVYTTQGDRYDLLADSYYGDSSLWWVISTANNDSEYDSLIPPIGEQIRIPNYSRIAEIIGDYESLNNI